MNLVDKLVIASHQSRYPDVSKATPEELLKLIFNHFKEINPAIPGYNPVDITVNVDIIRRVQSILGCIVPTDSERKEP
ncbi:MAG TPA: hypothetical protein VM577_05455 [Anaerovoracaceae bacterium]|nr:hypothetical protein [Anaerovoracaceae bacterium]